MIIGEVFGVVQNVDPLRILCTDGKERHFIGEPTVVFSAQQVALLYAEKLMARIKGAKQ